MSARTRSRPVREPSIPPPSSMPKEVLLPYVYFSLYPPGTGVKLTPSRTLLQLTRPGLALRKKANRLARREARASKRTSVGRPPMTEPLENPQEQGSLLRKKLAVEPIAKCGVTFHAK